MKTIYTTIVKDQTPYLLEIEIELKQENIELRQESYPSITATYSEIMTESECEQALEDWLGYDEVWKSSVEGGNTTDSLEEFNQAIRDEGFLNYLNVKETNVKFNNEDIYIEPHGCGCQHKMIEEALPQLKPIIDLHLCGTILSPKKHWNIYLGKECFKNINIGEICNILVKQILNNMKLPKLNEEEAIIQLLKYKMCNSCSYCLLADDNNNWNCEDYEPPKNVKNVKECYVWNGNTIKTYNFIKQNWKEVIV